MQTTVSDTELLTLQEAAQALRVTPVTVLRAIRSGKLEARRLGEHGRYRITAEALDAYLRPVKRGAA